MPVKPASHPRDQSRARKEPDSSTHRGILRLSKRGLIQVFFAILICALPTNAFADLTAAPKSVPATPSPEDNRIIHRDAGRHHATDHSPVRASVADTSTLHLVWPTLAILFLIIACAYAAKRWLPRAARIGGAGAINIIARHYISSKQSLCLVRVGDRLVLVGVAPDRLSTLTTIDDAVEVSRVVSSMERARPGSFSSTFQNLSATAAEVNATIEDDWQPVGGGNQRWSDVSTQVRGVVERVRAAGRTTTAPPA